MRPGIALAFVCVVATFAGADQKPGGSKTQPTSEQDYKLIGQLHEVTGKLVSVTPSDKTLTLQVEYPVLQPRNKNALKSANPQAQALYREQQRLWNQEQKALKASNSAHAAKQLQRLHHHAMRIKATGKKVYGDAFKVVTQRKEFDLQANDDVKVRLSKLPKQYDDKGAPIKYTDQELKERKGPDPNLPGYASSFEELKPGHIVKVTFGRAKSNAKDADAKDEHLSVTRILIEGEPPTKDDKKKK